MLSTTAHKFPLGFGYMNRLKLLIYPKSNGIHTKIEKQHIFLYVTKETQHGKQMPGMKHIRKS